MVVVANHLSLPAGLRSSHFESQVYLEIEHSTISRLSFYTFDCLLLSDLVQIHVIASSCVESIPFEPVNWDIAPSMLKALAQALAVVTVATQRAPHPLVLR